ncbi:MAG: hypothetical protein ACTSYR_05535 [Candidatus Odinarchaeia archaeon]
MSKVEKASKKVVETLGFPSETKVNVVLNIISLIDGYRINRCPDFRKLDESIKKGILGRKFAESWKNIRKVLWRIGTFPKNIPSVNKMMTIRILTQITSIIMMVIASVMVIAALFIELPSIVMFSGLTLYVVASAVLGFSMLIRRRIAIKIAEYYYEDRARWTKEQQFLKRKVQQLIDALIRHLRKLKIAGKDKNLNKLEKNASVKEYNKIMAKYKFKLFNVDYTGIRVIKKPSAIRKHYEVLPKI